jgi:hypothetical protein
MSAANKGEEAEGRRPVGRSGDEKEGRQCLQKVTPSSLAMAGGGIGVRKGSDHSHGSMIGAKGRDRCTTCFIGG